MSFYTQRKVHLSTLLREASICGKLYVEVNATDQGEENKKPRNALQVFCENLWMCFVYGNEGKRTMGWSERTPWWLEGACFHSQGTRLDCVSQLSLELRAARSLRFAQWRHRSGDETSRQASCIRSTGHHFNPELRKRHRIWEKFGGHLRRAIQSWNGEGSGPWIIPEGRVPIRNNLCKLRDARTMSAVISHQELSSPPLICYCIV